MKIKLRYVFSLGFVFVGTIMMAGCASIKLSPSAAHVIASPNKPPKSCHYLGQVTGSQGNFITGQLTSNQSLDSGAQNDLRN